jgi:hypothetical protein
MNRDINYYLRLLANVDSVGLNNNQLLAKYTGFSSELDMAQQLNFYLGKSGLDINQCLNLLAFGELSSRDNVTCLRFISGAELGSQSDLVLWGDGAFRQTLRFNGTDHVNLGDTGWVEQLFRGSQKIYSVETTFVWDGTEVEYLFGIGSSLSNLLFSISFFNGSVRIHVNNNPYIMGSTAGLVNKKITIKAKVDNISKKLFYTIDGSVSETSISNYDDTSWDSFLIGSRIVSSPQSNFTGLYTEARFFDDNDNLVESFSFSEGSGNITTGSGGGIGEIIDSVPTGIWNEKLNISKALDQNLVIVKKRDSETYNLNLASDTTLTALGFTNAYLTRTQLASLHNGTTIFTSPDDGLEPRVLAWPAGKVLTLDEIYKANLYVRRYL